MSHDMHMTCCGVRCVSVLQFFYQAGGALKEVVLNDCSEVCVCVRVYAGVYVHSFITDTIHRLLLCSPADR